MIHVLLFNDFQLSLGDRQINLRHNKSKAVIAWLALNNSTWSRDSIAELLWPHLERDRQLANLRVVLSELRKSCGSHLMVTTTGISLNRTISIDVSQFTTSISRKCRTFRDAKVIENGLSVYTGPLLHGFRVGDAPDFEFNIDLLRRHLTSMFIDATIDLCDYLIFHNQQNRAIMLLEKALNVEPNHDKLHTLYVKALDIADQPGQVIAYTTTRAQLANSYVQETSDKVLSELATANTTLFLDGEEFTYQSQLSTLPPILGRESQISQILELIYDSNTPVITFVGPGGVGKTRLAFEVIGRLYDPEYISKQQTANLPKQYHYDKIVFADLSEIMSKDEIVPKIFFAFQGQMVGYKPPLVELAQRIGLQRYLLVLDNLEHLIPHVNLVIDYIQAKCPNTQLVTTSRQRLRLRRERVISIRSLTVPTNDQSEADLFDNPAVQLFLYFSSLHSDADFSNDLYHIGQLCRVLDGLPLAIELAASRTALLSPKEILERLTNSNLNLTSPSHHVPLRHRSLEESISWSYSLLTDAAKQVLLTVHTLQNDGSLNAIVALSGLSEHESIDGALRLVDAGLATKHIFRGMTRLVLPASIVEYLTSRTDLYAQKQALDQKHVLYFLAQAENLAYQLKGRDQLETLRLMARDFHNYKSALQYAQSQSERVTFSKLCLSLAWFWTLTGYLSFGISNLEKAIELLNNPEEYKLSPLLKCQCQIYLAFFYILQGNENEAKMNLVSARDCLSANPSETILAQCINYEALLQIILNPQLTPAEIFDLCNKLDQAERKFKMVHDSWNQARVIYNKSHLETLAEDFVAALDTLERAVVIFSSLEDIRSIAMCKMQRGIIEELLGDSQEARKSLLSAFEELRGLGDIVQAARALSALAGNSVSLEMYNTAALLFGAAEHIYETTGLSFPSSYGGIIENYVKRARASIGEVNWGKYYKIGKAEGISVTIES